MFFLWPFQVMAWKFLVALMIIASIYMISNVSSESRGFVELLFNGGSILTSSYTDARDDFYSLRVMKKT